MHHEDVVAHLMRFALVYSLISLLTTVDAP